MDATPGINGNAASIRGTKGAPLDDVFPFVYAELRELAHRQLNHGRDGDTLSTTALVHEAYLRLSGDERVTAQGRAYFFAAAAQAMRRIVVDHARTRQRVKRGGRARTVALHESLTVMGAPELDVLDLERGMSELAKAAERPTRVVECRFYGGLSVEETALALGVTTRTVKRDWAFARAWLFDYLSGTSRAEQP